MGQNDFSRSKISGLSGPNSDIFNNLFLKCTKNVNEHASSYGF